MCVKKATFKLPRRKRVRWKPVKWDNLNSGETVDDLKSCEEFQDTDKHVMEQMLLISEVMIIGGHVM